MNIESMTDQQIIDYLLILYFFMFYLVQKSR